MRLVLDLQSCQGNGRFRGIGRYSMALARAMLEQNDPQQTFVVINNLFPYSENSIRSNFSSVIPAHNIKTFQILPNTSYSNAHSNGRLHANSCLREHFISGLNPDVVHVSSMFEGIGEDIVTSANLIGSDHAIGATIYDLIPLSNPKEYLPYKINQDWYASKIEQIKLVDTLLSISESARQEAINIVGISPEKITNISTAADDFFKKIDNDTASEKILIKDIGISKNFFMYTANYEPRKNYDRLIRAFAQIPTELRDSYQLVLVCSKSEQISTEIYKMAKREGLQSSDIVITGTVSDQLLRLLYSTCHMLVYPSLHEGFGLPVLEAMQCGAAVIGSNTTSIPEVIGRSDAMFNPVKVDEITALMIRSITDVGFLSMLREHGPRQAAKFSWKESARIALSALKESSERKTTAERSTGTLYGRFVRACTTQISSMSAPDVAAVASALTANSRQLSGSVSDQYAPRNADIISEDEMKLGEITYLQVSGSLHVPSKMPEEVPITSSLCRQADFLSDRYRYWIDKIRDKPRFHRKQWEFYYIIQVLHERGMLIPGRSGLGFGVGTEPLPALFASFGVDILASDQGIEGAVKSGWTQTNQHSKSSWDLNSLGICHSDVFEEKVRFREIDMNNIASDLSGKYDFCWSACCLEHLGSIHHGLKFIIESLNTLKPGGIAVHTTEFNMYSDNETFESADLSLFRRKDIDAVVKDLTNLGHTVEPIDWSLGDGFLDGYIDLPPYRQEPHLRLQIFGFPCTSIGLIIRKGGDLVGK